MPGLEIRLLGPFDARVHDAPLPPLRSRKGPWLLALLVLRHPREVERSWLAGTLWPESAESQALYSLRRSLTDLRAALGPEAARILSPTPHSLRLDLDGAEVDLLRFDEAVARSDAASLEAAVALYRGPLLEGCAEEWVLQERLVREQAYLGALEALAASAMGAGDYASAARSLQLALAADPFREAAAGSLMEALAAGGDPGAAARVYRDLERTLRRELDAEPAAETRAVFERLQEIAGRTEGRSPSRAPAPAPASPASYRLLPPGRPAAPPSPPPGTRRLPRPVTPLVGRDEEVREVSRLLESARLVTLTGAGGVGKTRLALQVAEELAVRFAEGACFASLAALSDPDRVPGAVAEALEIREAPGDPPGAADETDFLASVLRPQALLLVLDNCEHLAHACADVAERLLQACPYLKVLATSRQSLSLTGEVTWRVPSLALPVDGEWLMVDGRTRLQPSTINHQPSSLLEAPAVRLFVERAAAASPSFRLTEGNARAVVQICRRLDGIPLALELAAARVRFLTPEQIAGRLADRFRILTGGSRTALPRQQTLRATMDWSYELLSTPEQALLARLAVFAGGWTLEAAESIAECGMRNADWGTPGAVSEPGLRPEQGSSLPIPEVSIPQSAIRIPQWDVCDLLGQLVDRSLVQADAEGTTEARYFLLESVREYARERLAESGDEQSLRRAHVEYYLALAEDAERELGRAEETAALDRLEREHDNFRAAFDWLQSSESRVQGSAVPESSTLNPQPSTLNPDYTHTPLRLAAALWRFWEVRGFWREGRERLEEALAASEAAPGGAEDTLARVRSQALWGAGNLARREGDYAAAREHYEAGLALLRARDDRAGTGRLLHELGLVAYLEGDYGSARSFYEESLRIVQDQGNPRHLAALYNDLGEAARCQGEHEEARRLYERCLELGRELEDLHTVAGVLANLGNLAGEQGDYETAQRQGEQSLALLRQLGDRWGVALVLGNLALATLGLGDPGTALELLREGLALRVELGDRWGIAYSLDGIASARMALGHPAQAARLFAAAEAMRQELGAAKDPADRAGTDASLAAARAALGDEDFEAAWREGRRMSLDQAVRAARSTG